MSQPLRVAACLLEQSQPLPLLQSHWCWPRLVYWLLSSFCGTAGKMPQLKESCQRFALLLGDCLKRVMVSCLLLRLALLCLIAIAPAS